MAHITATVFSPSSSSGGGQVKAKAIQSLEVTECIKECQTELNGLQKELDAAKNNNNNNVAAAAGGQVHAHYAGVLLILCSQLQDVGEVQKELLKKQLSGSGSGSSSDSLLWSSRAGPKHKPKRTPHTRTKGLNANRRVEEEEEEGHSNPDDYRNHQHQHQQLEAENLVLLGELQRTHESAAQVEQSLVEISNLNQVFSTQVQQQSEQLEVLYEEALETSANFSGGNVELTKALEYNKQGGRYLLYMIVFFTLLLLLFDWYY
jgi:hypothetical protein